MHVNSICLFVGVLLLAGCATGAGKEDGSAGAGNGAYAHPELLIEAAQLARPEVAGQFVVLDARERSQYAQGHVPGARWVDHPAWAKAFGGGNDAQVWGRRIGELGIGAGSKVVVYDDSYAKDAARIWWILRYWGVDDVRLLNGGWTSWKAGKLPMETSEITPTPVTFSATARTNRLATKEQLLNSLKGDSLQIVDARSEKEFCGLEPMSNKRPGAIPGAKQLEWIDLIDKPTHRFKSADELHRLFKDAGISLDRPTAAHCQSGGRASVMAFTLELMGARDVSNYYPGWSEWGNSDDTPIVAGKARH